MNEYDDDDDEEEEEEVEDAAEEEEEEEPASAQAESGCSEEGDHRSFHFTPGDWC